jgi:MerR family transcriptional regulator, aldehyde-responsive regulator
VLGVTRAITPMPSIAARACSSLIAPNLRAVGLSIEDIRAYLASARGGDETAGEQRELFEAHARRLACEVAALELRRRYLDLKVRYWSAREAGDLDKAAAVAEKSHRSSPA